MIRINNGDKKVIFSYERNDFLMNFFSQRLQEDMSNSLHGFDQRTGYIQGGNNHHLLHEDEKYTSRIFQLQSALVTTYEQLVQIRVFINRYPLRKYYLSHGISQLDYIQYHIEALFHKVHTIHEVMLLMINEVYCLDLTQMKCRWKNITKKVLSTEAPLQHALKYYKTFQNLIELRHMNSHRGYFEDSIKDKIDIYHGLFFHKQEAYGFKLDDETKKMFPPNLTNYMLRKYKTGKVKLVDLVIEENQKLLQNFLGSFLPVYECQLQKFLGHEKKSVLRQFFKN